MLKKDLCVQMEMAHHSFMQILRNNTLVIFMNSKAKKKCYKLSKTEKEGGRKGKITKELE